MRNKSNHGASDIIGWLFLVALAALCLIAVGYCCQHSEPRPPPPLHTTAPPGYTLLTDGAGHYALRLDYAGGTVLSSFFGEQWTRQQWCDYAWSGYESRLAAERQYQDRQREAKREWKEAP